MEGRNGESESLGGLATHQEQAARGGRSPGAHEKEAECQSSALDGW